MLQPKRFGFYYLLSAIVAFFLQASPIQGQTSPYEDETLRGLKAVNVTVEDLGSEAEQGGLDRRMIKTDVELRLRKAGITIMPDNYRVPLGLRLSTVEKITGLKGEKAREKWRETHELGYIFTKEEEELEKLYNASATLYVNLHVMKIFQQSPHFIFNLNLEVQQVARLDRDTTITCYGAVTWNESFLGVAPADEMARFVRNGIGDLVDMFLNAYLSQNPLPERK